MAHVIVNRKMRERRPGSEYHPGNRVAFYIREGTEPKISDRAEDPVWGSQHDVPPDRDYYLKHQVVKSVSTVLSPLVDKPENLFEATIIELALQRNRQRRLTDMLIAAPPPAARGAGNEQEAGSTSTAPPPSAAPSRSLASLLALPAPAPPPLKKRRRKV